MSEYPESAAIKDAIEKASHIVIVQADNPDADSLASALAMEEILGDMGKQTTLYCGVDIPAYLQYLPGSSRVVNELPKKFDLSIILDTSSDSLLEQMEKSSQKSWLAAKPCIIIDHHATKPTISFASVICNHQAVATAELIYEIAGQSGWKLNQSACELIAIGILSDSLGLTSEATSARSIHIVAEVVEKGVKLAELENARRESMRREPELIHYKGRLLERVEFYDRDRIAVVVIPYNEIVEFSPLYNPPMLVLDDMRLGKDTRLAIAFKLYDDGKITAKIRANYGFGVADKLAEKFGGGGHPYAAGFKVTDGRGFDQLKEECLAAASEMINELEADE